MKTDVIVIGGGASGMAAAIEAARLGARVVLLEKKERLGKKLSVTGNGRCNYSNFYMTERNYRGHDLSFVKRVLHIHHTEDMVRWFESLGMLSGAKDAYLYPATNRAETVVSVLKNELERLNISVVLQANVTGIEKDKDAFTVTTDQGVYTSEKVIVSAGTEASVSDPRPYTMTAIIESLGHHVYPFRPALTELYGKPDKTFLWDGVRKNASVKFRDREASGEIQFTKNGISGIPVMQISRFVVNELEDRASSSVPVNVFLNFLPEYDESSLSLFLSERIASGDARPLGAFLEGWLPKKLLMAVAESDRDLFSKKTVSLSSRDVTEVIELLTSYPFAVFGHGDALRSHIMQGGVDLSEIRDTMESRLVRSLYLTGELLDVDGECGGYNLHFAFATGRIAGEDAARSLRTEETR